MSIPTTFFFPVAICNFIQSIGGKKDDVATPQLSDFITTFRLTIIYLRDSRKKVTLVTDSFCPNTPSFIARIYPGFSTVLCFMVPGSPLDWNSPAVNHHSLARLGGAGYDILYSRFLLVFLDVHPHPPPYGRRVRKSTFNLMSSRLILAICWGTAPPPVQIKTIPFFAPHTKTNPIFFCLVSTITIFL